MRSLERVRRIARKLTVHYERLRFAGWKQAPRKAPFLRKQRRAHVRPLIAYDLETSRIRSGDIRPLYLTAYAPDFQVSEPVETFEALCRVLTERFLIERFAGVRFVAWNGNNFDAYLIAKALLLDERFLLRPYLTSQNSLRGLRVELRCNRKMTWEFLDGMAMVGATSWSDRSLRFFLDRFAPDYAKLTAPDWSIEDFDSQNPDHVRYAERDSEGLYHGMIEAQRIVQQYFGMPLYPTIGNTAIRIFQANMPEGVIVWEPRLDVLQIIRSRVMRGGFCWINDDLQPYIGPVWKYDLNQAYAAAMRDCRLPAGSCFHLGARIHPYANAFIVQIHARNPRNLIPFYVRDIEGKQCFATKELEAAWITSDEYRQLIAEGWQIEVLDCYYWDETFTMKAFVDRLEYMRSTVPGGPNGAQGLMIKAIGNNAYGKTVEQLIGFEVILSKECPEGYYPFETENDLLQNCFFRFAQPVPRAYHQPQIGAFVTAHVRMVIRRALLQAPDAAVYADTDCVVFTRPVDLPLDATRYGFYKAEVKGCEYIFIDKKVYASADGRVKHAKGLVTDRLTKDDFTLWYHGHPPRQIQVQKQNFVRFIAGEPMFVERERTGSKMA